MALHVKNHMSREIKSIPPEMNAKVAMKILVESGASGLLVIDKDGRLAGVFTEKEILRTILPAYVGRLGAFHYGEDSMVGSKKISILEKYLVLDIMRTEVPTVEETDSLAEVSNIMLTKSERRVVVVRQGKPIGVITRADVIRAFASEAGML